MTNVGQPRINTDTIGPQPPNPPETPTQSSNPAPYDTRALEPVPLPEKYHAALRHVHTLEFHNSKLYQDNCRLVNAVNMLNERLAFLAAPQNIQMHRLVDIQEKLRTSEANRDLISQKYHELLHSVSTGSPHHHISAELRAIREAYASLERDHRLLGDKYVRLKAVFDTARVTPARGPVPMVRSEFANGTQFRADDQNRNNGALSTSVISPNSIPMHQDHRRRSSESGITQTLRSGPTPVATTWLAPLPTPPPSVPLAGGQILPAGLSVHAPVPAGSFSRPHHVPMNHDVCDSSRSPPVAPSLSLLEQGTSEQSHFVANGAVPCEKQISSTPLASSLRPLKRPSMELQTLTSPGAEYKKPRIEEAVDPSPTIDAGSCPTSETRSPPAPTDSSNVLTSSGSDPHVRSYQDCVNVIFEKDANVEDGVFCGLCFDRYEAKMIQEPPDILVRPSFNFLVTHCKTMHPTAWADLCRQT